MKGLIDFFAVAFLVQLLIAFTVAFAKDVFSSHRRALAAPFGFPTSLRLLLATGIAKLLHWFAVDYRKHAKGLGAHRLQPFEDAACAAPTHVVVLVRGTFGKLAYGEPWRKLAKSVRAIHPSAVFFRFNWAGRNGEMTRRADGAALAAGLQSLAQQYPQARLIAIGHSHGGTVIEHALGVLAGRLEVMPVVLATPQLRYVAKITDLPDARLTALLYAGALTVPAFGLVLASWIWGAKGQPSLMEWTADWLIPIGLLILLAAVAIRPLVWKARERLAVPVASPAWPVFRIWCKGDEVFKLFKQTHTIRLALNPLRSAYNERLEHLKAEPWLRIIAKEIAVAGLCWFLIAFSVEELARTDPAALPALARQPGPLRDLCVIISALMAKLLVHWRPRAYWALASMTSVVLFGMNVGMAQLCRVTLAGLSFTEGILVEVLVGDPAAQGELDGEVASSVTPGGLMRLHSATVVDDAVIAKLQGILRADHQPSGSPLIAPPAPRAAAAPCTS